MARWLEGERMSTGVARSSKAQREAWDATMRGEMGSASAPAKRHTTRAAKDRTASRKHNVHGGLNELEFKRLARLERLELTNAWDPLERASDFQEDADSSDDESRKRRSRQNSRASVKKQVFLADVILAEGESDFVRAQAKPSTRPCPVIVCDVTGKAAKYQDPLTGLWVHDRRALALLAEQVPPWLKATAISPYWDAVKSVQANGPEENS